jgi:nucleosome assembly protein 1-like 1
MSDLPKAVRNRVEALKKIQEEHDAVDEEYKQERIALEQRYITRRLVYYDRRRQIVDGEVEPEVQPEETEAEEDTPADEVPTKGIPQFWATALAAHPHIGDWITEEDLTALEHLTNITVEYDEKFTSFTLHFHFAENNFFTNTVSFISTSCLNNF